MTLLARLVQLHEQEPWKLSNASEFRVETREVLDALPALIEVVEAAQNISGLACGAWPELAAALAPFKEEGAEP